MWSNFYLFGSHFIFLSLGNLPNKYQIQIPYSQTEGVKLEKRNLHAIVKGQWMQTCKWTVQVGQATSFIRVPDPLNVKPVNSRSMSAIEQRKLSN